MNSNICKLLIFFGLTFLFSWSVWCTAILLHLTFADPAGKLFYLIGGCGPSIVGLILHYRTAKKEERSEIWRSLIDIRRVSCGWWAIILLGYPFTALIASCVSQGSGNSLPGAILLRQLAQSPFLLIPFLLQILVTGPLAEEFGWRGYALPHLLKSWGVIRASLVLSLIWCAWHLPLFAFAGSTHFKFGWFTPEFWLFLASIIPLGLVIGLAYSRSRGSLLVAVTMHFMYNLTLNLIAPISRNLLLIQVIIWWGWGVFYLGITHKEIFRFLNPTHRISIN